MLAAAVTSFSKDDPLHGLRVDDVGEPEPPAGWVVVDVRACALNRHDLWSLQGVGLDQDQLPMILGCDAAGVDALGNEVIVYPVISSNGWFGDETLDPRRTLLSERFPGTLAERVAVPVRNLVPKPPELSFEEAACLPTAWLTAYRMLFTKAQARPGSTVLVQGAGGGVSTALVQLGSAAGVRMWVTSASEAKLELALQLGAERTFAPGERLPERVDAVMETVGAATWSHSVRSVRDGGAIVVSGATTGDASPAQLSHVFFRQLSVLGSTMGTLDDLARLVRFCVEAGIRPTVDEVLPLAEARTAFAALLEGERFGKIVLRP